MYIGRGGFDCALKFVARVSDAGEYTFESTWMPGFYLAVDDKIDYGRPFLAQMFGASFQDIRLRFELYAAKKELQSVLHEFANIDPLGSHSDSTVLQTERVELTRYQIAQIGRPSYFESLIEIDHLAEVPILSRFQPSQRATKLRLH